MVEYIRNIPIKMEFPQLYRSNRWKNIQIRPPPTGSEYFKYKQEPYGANTIANVISMVNFGGFH